MTTLCLTIFFPRYGSAEIFFNLENPGQNQNVSGISLISGWVFSSVAGAQVTVKYRIDSLVSGEVPCCVDRADVANTPEYQQYPQALRSGFGLLVNFNLLANGVHTLVLEVTDDKGSPPKSETVTFSASRPGGFQFLSDLNVAAAKSEDITWDSDHQSFFVKGALATDQATEKEQKVNLRMGWNFTTQTLGITQSENVGEPTGGNPDKDGDGVTPPGDCNDDNASVHPGAQEICDDTIDNDCNGAIDKNDVRCGASLKPIQMTLENPINNPLSTTTPMLGGVGVVSGWAFSTTPEASVNSVRFRVDGNIVGDLPCCTDRLDVQHAYPNLPQALRSGFGALTNFSLLASGSHTFSVEAQNSAGETQKIEQAVSTTKLADSQFLDQFDLSEANAVLFGDLVSLEDVKVRDKATRQESTITASYLWEQSCQCFVVQQECGNGTTEKEEECDDRDLEASSCSSFGFRGGALACRPRCTADDKNCFLPCTFDLKDCQGSPAVYVTNTKSNNVSVIDPITNKVTATIKVGKEPRGVAASPDGSTVYVTNFLDDTLSIIHRATNIVTDTIPVGDGPIGVAVAPDGAHVYVVNGLDDTVSVIAAASKKLDETIQVGKEPQAIALTPDGERAYVTNYRDSSVSVLDLTTNTANPKVIFVKNGPNGIAMAPDGKKVYVVNFGFADDTEAEGTVSVIDVATGKVTGTVLVESRPVKIAVSPDNKQAFVSNSLSGSVSVIDLATLTVSRTIPAFSGGISNPDGVALLGGHRLYVALFGNEFSSTVQVFSATTPTLFAEIEVGEGPFAIAVAPAL
jgi:YVTN family beta-propeller protein/cysteine-rich repeat protein